ncbi:MAG: hypothetical protein MJ236_06710 [Clostridia bacterium]|nr:hypothetical protein [Clostridia bacterium]
MAAVSPATLLASTSAIDKLYAKKCETEGRNFFTVPKKNQPAVRAIIEADGYMILDDGSVVPATE